MARSLELPPEERESVDAGMRHIEFLDTEIAAVERLIAQQALSWPEIRRLMTVPGVNLICAASFIAAVGDPTGSMTSRKLVAYLGLDPASSSPARDRRAAGGSQNADHRPRGGRWSRRRGPRCCNPARCTASISAPSPPRARQSVVATARKLAVLFWCMLTRDQDYAHQQPSLTRKKLRRLEITAGAPKYTRRAAGIWSTNDLMRDAELELARQAETSYKRMVQDQQAGAPARKVGASATPERA